MVRADERRDKADTISGLNPARTTKDVTRRGFLGLLVAAVGVQLPASRFRLKAETWCGADWATSPDRTAFVAIATHDQAEAIFLQARRLSREAIASWFDVPAHLVGEAPYYIVTPQGR